MEIHNKKELEYSLEIGAVAIGINTRDLDTFTIHPELISELAPSIPKNCIRIAESGIHSSKDLLESKDLVDGFLIGTYFMKQPNIEAAYQELVANVYNRSV